GRRPAPATRASRLCPRALRLGGAPVFGQQRPSLVVAPAPGDLQIAPREAFARKARTPHQRQRRRVARLYVGLDAVQLDRSEGELQAERQSLLHVAPARVGRQRVIAEIGTVEGTA